ncbi:hypothetical protein LOZ65_006086 [Ophidiomyces ophidiicola]|nr:hypothetical protein LOZ65_006086 [Ophidiomyces ophidiicola]
MAESRSYHPGVASDNGVDLEDPFVSHTPVGNYSQPHRYTSFDTHFFSLNASSPLQIKRALEAHLAETERRLQETSKLGTSLVEQQRELSEKLGEVERQQADGEIGPDLRQRLQDLEKEYNEIGRETARVALGPRMRAVGQDDGLTTSSLDSRVRHHASPSIFSSQATNSPSKVSVPSRKQRNQPSTRVHDIEFATEISTSLLAQVRQLQILLAEREETVKALNLEKSRLELEAEGFTQRLRSLDESEQRYKDENWGLETQTHELLAAAKESSDRESRLNTSLNALAIEKSNIQRELDELKQAHGKLTEENLTAQKTYDSELHILRRNVNLGETERKSLQHKVEELAGQNQELAKAVAAKLRHNETDFGKNLSLEEENKKSDESTPENSPPPSPNKPTPRHGHLESETLKSSLHHAHRMIQTLKGTIHREKTEKIELKRMLQEARDELEQRRTEPARPLSSHNRRQKQKADAFKKPPRPEMLGAGRRGTTQIEVAEPDWEDESFEPSPTRAIPLSRRPVFQSGMDSASASDAYQTANETEGFETANERETATESDAFQTGAENFVGDSSDDLTETESRAGRTDTIRVKRPGQLPASRPISFVSTASTSGDEDEYTEVRTPVQTQPPRYRLKMSRGRRNRASQEVHTRQGSVPLSPRDSPASLNSPPQSPHQRTVSGGQSLFAELDGFVGAGSDGEFGAPLRSNTASEVSTPSRRQSFATFPDSSRPSTSKHISMIDSSTMTEPLTDVAEVKHIGTSTEAREFADASTTYERVVLTDSATQAAPSEPSCHSESEIMATLDISPIPVSEKPHHDSHMAIGAVPIPTAMSNEPATKSVIPEPSSYSESGIATTLDIPPILAAEKPQNSRHMAAGTVPIPIAMSNKPATQSVIPEPSSYSESGITTTLDIPPILAAEKPQNKGHMAIGAVPIPIPISKKSASLANSSIYSEHTIPLATTPTQVQQQNSSMEMQLSQITSTNTAPIVPVEPTKSTSELVISSIHSTSTIPTVIGPMESQVLELSPIITSGTPPQEPSVSIPTVELALSRIQHAESTPKRPMTAVQTSGSLGGLLLASKLPSHISSEPVVNDRGIQHGISTLDKGVDTSPTSKIVESNESPTVQAVPAVSEVPSRQAVNTSEVSAQTILTGAQIDKLLIERQSSRPVTAIENKQAQEGILSTQASPSATPKAKPQQLSQTGVFLNPGHPASRRPGSAGSQRFNSFSHPPLPVDHKQAIAAATQKVPLDNSISIMGPPTAPASSYRGASNTRPHTPNDQTSRASVRNLTTPRTNFRRTSTSMTSRRSSVSSFASELDERFNLAKGAYPFDSGADPRLIQAITQTMIGEFLWKYTRKPGRSDMSNTRHQRYFWVHPYTRTLYWSTHDPQVAGKMQHKAKSVAIEAVRVVNDDNPYPPGLHRKSLEIVTPGRVIKFTAATSQRHETWFNALSYLLIRTADGESNDEDGGWEASSEIHSTNGRVSRQAESRRSVSSRNSHTTRAISKQFIEVTPTLRRPITPNQASPSISSRPGSSLRHEQNRQGSVSRMSGVLRPSGIKSTFSSRRSRYGNANTSIDTTSAASNDSAEDLRRVIERQERDADRLENVRACCDGESIYISEINFESIVIRY